MDALQVKNNIGRLLDGFTQVVFDGATTLASGAFDFPFEFTIEDVWCRLGACS